MYRKVTASLLTLLLCSPALAQTANPYSGTWKLSFDGPRTGNLEGKVVINGNEGTYLQDPGNSRNACFKPEAPIVVESSTPEELVFKVYRSKVLAGCEDTTMTYKKIDEKTLKRVTSDGRNFTLTRQ